ncbi:conserved hypothetical protein [Stutzerimonas stutzeri A1501]|uniref:Uncharacterized protein n=1 Tax=Stutzerimonas stutzeri (strain A1501) TaxID=379731 RepID=A4VKS9_STUS1|nr:conserved hypothetical protein [Stutzerimonas stutzeri A1501]
MRPGQPLASGLAGSVSFLSLGVSTALRASIPNVFSAHARLARGQAAGCQSGRKSQSRHRAFPLLCLAAADQ